MSPANSGSRWRRRVDVRLGLGLIGAIGGLLVVLMSTYFFVFIHDTVEILEAVLQHELDAADPGIGGRDVVVAEAPHHARGAIAIRRVGPDGTIELLRGEWPASGRTFHAGASSLRLAFAGETDQLVDGRVLPDGDRLEAVVSLEEFAHERREQFARILLSLASTGIGLVVVAWLATRLALAPLRAATRAVEGIDEGHLDARLPLRGAGDDMDRHARALNHVLQRLEDAFQRMSSFSADVAHELRTPVNRMLNLADVALLRRGAEDGSPDGSPDASSDLIAVREAAEDMRRLIENLLLLAKGEEGRLALRREPLSLAQLSADLLELFRPTCEERGIDLSLVLPTDDCSVVGDRSLLQRALSNLLDNAVRHTPDGGKIELAVSADDARVELSVSDSGRGIPESDRERVFERFVQLDEARTGNGIGLGLALVRMIARLQGGDVSAARSPLGGACLRLALPRAPASDEPRIGAT